MTTLVTIDLSTLVGKCPACIESLEDRNQLQRDIDERYLESELELREAKKRNRYHEFMEMDLQRWESYREYCQATKDRFGPSRGLPFCRICLRQCETCHGCGFPIDTTHGKLGLLILQHTSIPALYQNDWTYHCCQLCFETGKVPKEELG